MTTLFESSQWNTSPTALWTLQYEYQRKDADMQYRFYWKVWLGYNTSYYNNGLQLQLFLNGVQYNVTVKGFNSSSTGWSYEGTTDWYTVPSKTSGTVPFYAKLYDTNVHSVKVTSSTYALTVSGAASAFGSVASFDVDDGFTVSITKYDTTFTDTLVVSYDGTTVKTVSGITNGTKVTFANELTTIYNLMKNVKSGTFTFDLTTTSGSTLIGSSTQTATGSITNANPKFGGEQVDYADTNGASVNVTGNARHIVQNQSYLVVTFGAATGNKGATITEYTIEVNGVTKTAVNSGSVDFGLINSSQDVELKVTAFDSRGNNTVVSKTVTVLAWTSPIFTATIERLNNYEDTTYLTVDATVPYLNGKNEATITYMVKQNGGEFGDVQEIENNRRYTVYCDKNFLHTFVITVVDAFDSTTKEFTLPKGRFPLFIDTELNAVGVNEFPSNGEALKVAGGVARFDDGIVLKSQSGKMFLVSVTDTGTLAIEEYFLGVM